MTQSVELRQYLLGMQPYTVVQLGLTDGGDFSLTAEFGGGAEDAVTLPLMLVSETSATEAHPLAVRLREIYAEADDRGIAGDGWRAAVVAIVEEFNEEWLPFVQADKPGGLTDGVPQIHPQQR
jgi:hypothetical protein